VLHRDLGDDKYRAAPLLRTMVAAGRLAGRAARDSMSIAIEPPGLSETQRQIVELAREFARTKIEPFAADWAAGRTSTAR